VETHWLPYFEGDGRERAAVHAIGTVQDITERKEREEKERLLMEEINHRAKNMLSVVHSIAKKTATQTPEDFIERFSGRIHALSATQNLLVWNVWDGVEIEDLVRAQLGHFADLVGSRIATDGPKLRMMPASAQAIGLALHELATNAGSSDRHREAGAADDHPGPVAPHGRLGKWHPVQPHACPRRLRQRGGVPGAANLGGADRQF
jgi:hypothetical protein